MEVEMLSIILGLIVAGLSLYALFTYMGAHLNNGLCENKYTAALYDYKDYGEGVNYPVWKSDCCYDSERAQKVCNNYKNALIDKCRQEGGVDCTSVYTDMCDDTSKNNPANLFSCVESTKLCDDDECVQSCDNDGICKREMGEGFWCGDCQ